MTLSDEIVQSMIEDLHDVFTAYDKRHPIKPGDIVRIKPAFAEDTLQPERPIVVLETFSPMRNTAHGTPMQRFDIRDIRVAFFNETGLLCFAADNSRYFEPWKTDADSETPAEGRGS
jgi:hypothetical protein